MEENIVLETKFIGQIEGQFIIKSYQRGYRWSRDEVQRLLTDINQNKDENYCLQPIVVKKENDCYELIDGQQRLTTIYLIYQYIHNKIPYFSAPKFSLDYQTREKSKEFLNDIDISRKNENIDFWYMSEAFEAIDEWFSNDNQSNLPYFTKYFDEKVKVIWYEVNNDTESIPLFTRLNIGKIPLTCSELVKAMFLSQFLSQQKISTNRQNEISLQWDNMERALSDNNFWYFLTNKSSSEYKTRIDLVLDLLVNKPTKCKEKYYTFFEIDKMKNEKSLIEIWNEIQNTYLTLYDWYENHEFYHKIGYLISSGYITLQEIYNNSKNKTKDEFLSLINNEIKNSIDFEKNYGELNYEKANEKDQIQRLLLLFNIESVRKNGEQTQWFPFGKYKFNENGKEIWSLEHIHAQQAEGMKTIEAWKEWLRLHLESIKNIESDNYVLIGQIENAVEKENLTFEEFNQLYQEILLKLTRTNTNRNTIANLALLNSKDNSALNNSTFDVKRKRIIEMDKRGAYIPFCTKMVFFKYYSEAKDNTLHFWDINDMKSYVSFINEILKEYMNGKKIIIESELNENDE